MDIGYVGFLIALACLKAIYFLILVIFDFIKEHLKEYKFHKKEIGIKPEFDKK